MGEQLFDSEFLSQLEQLRLRFRARASGKSGDGRRSRHQGVSILTLALFLSLNGALGIIEIEKRTFYLIYTNETETVERLYGLYE